MSLLLIVLTSVTKTSAIFCLPIPPCFHPLLVIFIFENQLLFHSNFCLRINLIPGNIKAAKALTVLRQ